MAEPGWRRLHPGTIVVAFAKQIQQFLTVIIVFVVLSAMGSRGDTTEIMFAALGLIAIVSPILRYVTTRFKIEDGVLTLRSGLLWRSVRTVPVDRIQNLRLNRTWLHRLLNLVDVQIETAAGAGVEIELSALDTETADALRAELQAPHPHDALAPSEGDPSDPSPPTGPVLRLTSKELLLAGLTENRAGTLIGAVFAFGAFGESFGNVIVPVVRAFERLNIPPQFLALSIVGIVVGVWIIGWLLAIGSVFLNYSNFELRPIGGRLHRKHGLINQAEETVPSARVQVLVVSANPWQRWFGVSKIYVQTAGSATEGKTGESSLLCPLIQSDRIPEIGSWIRSEFNELGNPRPLGPKALWRRIRSSLIPLAIIVGAAALVPWKPGAWIVAGGIVAWAWLSIAINWRASGWTEGERTAEWVHGGWRRERFLVPIERVQGIEITSTPLQRRLGLATLIVGTAATGSGARISFADLPAQEAVAAAERLRRRLADYTAAEV